MPNAENRFSKEKYFTACDSLIITGNGDDFMQKNAFHTLSYGVYAVTAMDGERPVGCIANSAMQITSQPPTLAISINQQNLSLIHI